MLATRHCLLATRDSRSIVNQVYAAHPMHSTFYVHTRALMLGRWPLAHMNRQVGPSS